MSIETQAVSLFDVVPGNVFWVDSVNGDDSKAGTFNSPLASLDAAQSKVTANNGDVVYLKPNHSENLSAAAAITMDKAGVTVVGVGFGAIQPNLRWTAATADMNITAASVRFVNVRFTAAVQDVASGIDVSAVNGIEFHNCRFDESGTADENWLNVIDVADGADNFVIKNCTYRGDDADNNTFVDLQGTHENTQIVGNTFYTGVTQGSQDSQIASGTQQIGILIADNFFHSETTDADNTFVDLTGTTNNGWALNNMLSSVDTDANAAKVITAFDVTGLMSRGNFFTSGVADTHGVETFTTVDNLT